MKIVCIALPTTHRIVRNAGSPYSESRHSDSRHSDSPCSETPRSKYPQSISKSAMPVEIAAIISALLDAGHRVHWIEKRLCSSSIDNIVRRVTAIDPDVLLFMCDGYPDLPLMANVAVRGSGVPGREYIAETVMRPAWHWVSALTALESNCRDLVVKIERSNEVRNRKAAMNDCITDAVN